jgi:hypothetical protein
MRKHSLDRTLAEREAIDHRINSIVEKAAQLRKQVDEYKIYAADQKESLQRRRKELALGKVELEKSKPRNLLPVQTTIKKTSQRLEKVRGRVVDARSLLCREAALAMDFRRRKGSNGRTEYVLGSIVVPDLRELNTRTQPQAKAPLVGGRTVAEPHDLVSEAFDNVARLVNICAYYLSVRLPGEILLPHEKFPRAAMMPEKASYRHTDLEFPGFSSSQFLSPAASRVIDRDTPRPRPLWLDRPLGSLAREDPKSYGLYIEGVTMLAYNVAWLCRTQGVDNINSFDDVCAVGRNLYQLLMNHQRRSVPRPILDRRESGAPSKATPTNETQSRSEACLGTFSHNSAQHNLAGLEGLNFMKDWRIGSSGRLADKLRSYLLNEITGAEWDVLDKGEWDEDREDERPVLVGGSQRPNESRYATMSIMTVAPHDGADEERSSSAAEGKQKAGKTGWMKLRGRSEDLP